MTLFLSFELKKFVTYFKTRTLAKVITALLFIAVFVFVGSGIYYFFLSGFRYINVEAVEDIRSALTLFLYEVFLIILGAVIIFSAMVSGVFNLFLGNNNNWIMSSPSFTFLPKLVLVRSLMASFLPSLVLFLPAILAFTKVHHLEATSLVLIGCSVLFFLVALNALTLILMVLVGILYHALSKRWKVLAFTFKDFILLLLVIVTGVVITVWNLVRNVDLIKLFRAENVDENLSIANIAQHFTFLPSHPFALELLYLQNKEPGTALTYFFILLAIATLLLVVWWWMSPLFYPLWKRFQEGATEPRDTMIAKVEAPRFTYRFMSGKTMALFQKESLIFSRNMKGVLWFLFLTFIWLAQIGTHVVLTKNIARYETDISVQHNILQALQYIIAIYFISSFTLRFVFPSLSTEKKTVWILGTAPLSFKKIFYGKYLFFVTFFTSLGVLMNYINIMALHLSVTHSLYSMMLFVSTLIFVVTFGLSLGALFPSTETDDPEAISTSMPGLFFTACSLGYGAVSAWILYTSLLLQDVSMLILFVLFTIALIALMLYKTPSLVTYRIKNS